MSGGRGRPGRGGSGLGRLGRVRKALGGVGRGRTGWCWRCCCGRRGSVTNTASCCTFAVRRFNADLSAWPGRKLAREGLWGPSVALGVIPPLCAILGPVLAGPEGCSRGRWRSGPSKWRHTAAPEGRGQGAPRTCRCIETNSRNSSIARGWLVREHHAPVGALRLPGERVLAHLAQVREHRAPVGALRHQRSECKQSTGGVREHRAPVGALRHQRSECKQSTGGVREHHAPVGTLRQESE